MSLYYITLQSPPRFQDVPQFTQFSGYSVDVAWAYTHRWLETHQGEDQVLDMDPDFQRGHVWDLKKQAAFIEFSLRGGDSACNIYWNCPYYQAPRDGVSTITLVDGKQRLTAVLKFLANEVPVFGGHLYEDFTDKLRLIRPRLRMCVNDLRSRAEVLQWYLDLNTGGVVHTDEEIDMVRRLLAQETEK